MKHFVTAYAVCSEAFAADVFKKPSLYIGLYGVMYLYVVLLSKFRYMVNGLAEKLHVIIVEWSRDLVKLLYCIDVQHNILILVVESLRHLKNRGKTVAKITKKSVFSQNDVD